MYSLILELENRKTILCKFDLPENIGLLSLNFPAVDIILTSKAIECNDGTMIFNYRLGFADNIRVDKFLENIEAKNTVWYKSVRITKNLREQPTRTFSCPIQIHCDATI